MANETKYPNITVKLLGEDGNAFFLIGKTSQALRRGGVSTEKIQEFKDEAMSGNYDNVLVTIMNWVEIE